MQAKQINGGRDIGDPVLSGIRKIMPPSVRSTFLPSPESAESGPDFAKETASVAFAPTSPCRHKMCSSETRQAETPATGSDNGCEHSDGDSGYCRSELPPEHLRRAGLSRRRRGIDVPAQHPRRPRHEF